MTRGVLEHDDGYASETGYCSTRRSVANFDKQNHYRDNDRQKSVGTRRERRTRETHATTENVPSPPGERLGSLK